MKNLYLKYLVALLYYATIVPSYGQNCGCDFTIPPSMSSLDGNNLNLSVVKVICIQGGDRGVLKIKNFRTENASTPFIFKNCGGTAKLTGDPKYNGYCLSFENCKNFRVTGGDGSTYGIELNGAVNGVQIGEYSTDCEVDHIFATNHTFAGMQIKTDPKCDLSSNFGHFTMRNIKIHDNKITNVEGEGFYIGNSFYSSGFLPSKMLGASASNYYKGCENTLLFPHDLKGVYVYNNITDHTGREGIQIGCANKDVFVYNNTITDFGYLNLDAQSNGMQIGEGTTGNWYNNKIKNGLAHGIIILGCGNIKVFNNLIMDTGQNCTSSCSKINGIYCDNRDSTVAGSKIEIINNTIINTPGTSINQLSEVTNNSIINNILIGNNAGISLGSGVSATQTTNYTNSNIDNVNFLNYYRDDFHLTQSSSCCIDNGSNVTSNGVTIDFDNKSRPAGTGFDLGAYEYGSSMNLPPSAYATSDYTTSKYNSGIILHGSGQDPDGAITSYSWVQLAGPNTATLTNANTANLTLTNQIEGTYTLQLTVTDNGSPSLTNSDIVNITFIDNRCPFPFGSEVKVLTLPTNSTTLTCDPFDGDGYISAYQWVQNTNNGPPSIATLTNANTQTVTVSDLIEGSYLFAFFVTDNDGCTRGSQSRIEVTPNQYPIVNAGKSVYVKLPSNSVVLSGNAYDNDGYIVSYAWTQTSGPNSSSIVNQNTTTPTISNLIAGTYIFTLTATDDYGKSISDDVFVTVQYNDVPNVSAGQNKILALPINNVSLKGTADDSDGYITNYLWTKQSGPNNPILNGKNTPNLTVKDLTEGTYIFKLETTDNDGSTNYDLVTLNTISNDTAGRILYRVNCGSANVISSTPNWASDNQTSPSTYLDASSSNYTTGSASWTGTNTTGAPDSVFRTNRYDSPTGGPMKWNFNLTKNGWYEIRLYFAVKPGSTKDAIGQRIFDVNIEDELILDNFDIYKEAGMAATKKVFIVEVNDLMLNIDFLRVVGNAQINGIEILTASEPVNFNTDILYRINCGNAYSVPDYPIGWESDYQTVPSIYFDTLGSNQTIDSILWSGTNNTYAPDSIFGSNRYSSIDSLPLSYNFPVPNGNYEIRLYFAVKPGSTIDSIGERVFDVEIENMEMLSDYDIYASSGMNADVKVFDISIDDGNIDIDFIKNVGNPQINGIEILAINIPISSGGNLCPRVNAGAEKIIKLPTNSISINGSATDNDGTVSSYSWSKVSGPAGGSISDSTTSNPTFNNLSQGVYVYKFDVTDNDGCKVSDYVNINVLNAIYRVNCGQNSTITASPVNWGIDYQTNVSPYLASTSSNHTTGSSSWSGTNTTGAPNNIFGSNRYDNSVAGGPMQWNFPVYNGWHEVRLYFAVKFGSTIDGVGQRVFDVKIEDGTYLDHYDIYSDVGMAPTKKSFLVNITDGNIDIDFGRLTGSPQINGIEIYSAKNPPSGSKMISSNNDWDVSEESLNVYPNPFNEKVTIYYSSKNDNKIKLEIYDLKGELIGKIYEGNVIVNTNYEYEFDGRSLPDGIYICRCISNEGVTFKKIVLNK